MDGRSTVEDEPIAAMIASARPASARKEALF